MGERQRKMISEAKEDKKYTEKAKGKHWEVEGGKTDSTGVNHI